MNFEDDGMSIRQRTRMAQAREERSSRDYRAAAVDWIKFQSLCFGIIGTVGFMLLFPVVVAVLWFFIAGITRLLGG